MPQFTPQQALKRQMVFYPIAALIIIAVFWIYWAIAPASAAGFGISNMPGSERFVLAIIATILSPVGLAFSLFKTRMLISRGKMGEARFVKFGSMTTKSTQAVTFEYVVAGRPYSVTQSVPIRVAEQYAKNMRAPVIYDSAKPSRAKVFTNYNAQIDTSGPTAREATVQAVNNTVFTAVVAVLALGQWVIVITALHFMNDQYDIEVYGPASLGVAALTLFEVYLYDLWTNKVSLAYEARFKFGKRLLLPLAVVSIIWTSWAMYSESQQIERDRASARQAEIDRAAAGQQQRDLAASMQALQNAINRRNAAKSAQP